MTYCIDTSSLIAAWQERYPIENFPNVWVKVDALIDAGRLIAPVDVLHEIKKRSDELHDWLKARRKMFRELDDAVQIEAAQVLSQFPRLVGERKLRTSADPFVIALARIEGFQLVTDEKPTGSLSRPNIPDVCAELSMTTINILDLIRAEKWIVG
jgi:Domain of unknown function (DUF4411)